MKKWQRAPWIAALLFAFWFMSLPTAEPAAHTTEGDLATASLREDIKILGEMIGQDLSGYKPPVVSILSLDGFRAIIAENVTRGELPPGDYVGFFDCDDRDRLLISTEYVAAADATKTDPRKYFLLTRFHELYHWAMCVTGGKYRFRINRDPQYPVNVALWYKEEYMANMLERRYLIERLGTVTPTEKDFRSVPHPNRMRAKFPKDPLLQLALPWDLDQGLVPASTEDNNNIFIYIWFAKVPDQSGRLQYVFNLISHRGEAVEIRIFKDGQLFHGWTDKGYVGNPLSEKFPANPVYVGEWVQFK